MPCAAYVCGQEAALLAPVPVPLSYRMLRTHPVVTPRHHTPEGLRKQSKGACADLSLDGQKPAGPATSAGTTDITAYNGPCAAPR
ncbi:hypothetical protein GCM10010129_78910 [Streptomyces fumigatiscleroticus]|nr:hypothetical protein GCM10010129_78910 [Streptomyces fumigatiscleroticus]